MFDEEGIVDDPNYDCIFCEKNLNSTQELKEHILSDHKNNYCDKQTAGLKKAKTERKSKVCSECGKTFRTFSEMNNHFGKHGESEKAKRNKLMCTFCGKELSTSFWLKDHIERCHSLTPKRSSDCKFCERSFKTKYILGAHMRRDHPQMGSFKGRRAPKLIDPDNPMKWRNDLKGMPEKSSKSCKSSTNCKFCNEKFTSQYLLLHHTKQEHGDQVGSAPCKYCDEVFPNTYLRTPHMRKVHPGVKKILLRNQRERGELIKEETEDSQEKNKNNDTESQFHEIDSEESVKKASYYMDKYDIEACVEESQEHNTMIKNATLDFHEMKKVFESNSGKTESIENIDEALFYDETHDRMLNENITETTTNIENMKETCNQYEEKEEKDNSENKPEEKIEFVEEKKELGEIESEKKEFGEIDSEKKKFDETLFYDKTHDIMLNENITETTPNIENMKETCNQYEKEEEEEEKDNSENKPEEKKGFGEIESDFSEPFNETKFSENLGKCIVNCDDKTEMENETNDYNESIVQDNNHIIGEVIIENNIEKKGEDVENESKPEFLTKNEMEERRCSEEDIVAQIKGIVHEIEKTNSDIKELVDIEKSDFTCGQCGSNYQTKYSLHKHIRRIHNSKLLSCNFCDFTTKFKDSITKHIKKGHERKVPERKKLICDQCPFTANYKSILNEHRLKHGEAMFTCDIWGSSHSKESNLRRHKLVMHTTLTPGVSPSRPQEKFFCHICPSSFSRKRDLKGHIQTHKPKETLCTSKSPTKPVSLPSETSKRKDQLITIIDGVYTCTVCGLTSRRNDKCQLREHVEVHMEGVEHTCDLCGKVKRTSKALRTHRRRCLVNLK